VVCHSRGGLVASWLLRLAPLRVRQVVFVGSPLAGTSLASPYRLRAALDMLANVANALSLVGSAASAGVSAGRRAPPAWPRCWARP
jgi:pimeloyl-ACP methyl ester carboxylesterase